MLDQERTQLHFRRTAFLEQVPSPDPMRKQNRLTWSSNRRPTRAELPPRSTSLEIATQMRPEMALLVRDDSTGPVGTDDAG